MDKILSFVINLNKEFLILKGSPDDPQFKKSLWYVVTGGCEPQDINKVSTVKREIKEETNLDVLSTMHLNWIFKYNSLGKDCTEYAYISLVEDRNIKLNEENIEYKWCELDEFIELIDWFGDKKELKNVLEKALENYLYFKIEKIEEFL